MMKNCPSPDDLFESLSLDSSGFPQGEMGRHIQSCLTCQNQVLELQNLRKNLFIHPSAFQAPPGFVQGVMAALADEPEKTGGWEKLFEWGVPATALAGVALLFALLFGSPQPVVSVDDLINGSPSETMVSDFDAVLNS